MSYSSRITHGNKYFRRCVLAMAQACANQKKNRSGLGNMFQRLRERKECSVNGGSQNSSGLDEILG